MGIRFRNDSTEVSCDRSVPMKIKAGRLLCGCMRTKGHKGTCIAGSYDAARADGVCYGCRAPVHALHKKDCLATKMVECAFCLQRFEPVCDDVSYHVGLDCSARVHTGITASTIMGYFGSAYDFEMLVFDGTPVGFEYADPVCDGCIRGFIEQGALKELPGRGLFGAR
jgi:hypothetical protein